MSLLNLKFQLLTIFCGCTAWFLLDLVRNFNCWYCDAKAHFISIPGEVDLMLQKEGLSLSDVEDAPLDSLRLMLQKEGLSLSDVEDAPLDLL